uniref:Potassium channel toxin n=1 Tax=Urodacus yaschenkoi TaxID=1273102 RepID=A0A0A0PTG7_UROYA|nr:potassium channel toxin precursor [Urodacus yaschenkoi]
MNAKLIYLLLVVTTMMLMFDTTQAQDKKCSSINDCFVHCKKKTGFSFPICANKRCKCFVCNA